MSDLISRQTAIDALVGITMFKTKHELMQRVNASVQDEQGWLGAVAECLDEIEDLPSAQPELEKYEYHYDHTDCIWYRPEARNRCPTTCAQYRDGWNDAMNYIFRDGKGYRPFRRDRHYEE